MQLALELSAGDRWSRAGSVTDYASLPHRNYVTRMFFSSWGGIRRNERLSHDLNNVLRSAVAQKTALDTGWMEKYTFKQNIFIQMQMRK